MNLKALGTCCVSAQNSGSGGSYEPLGGGSQEFCGMGGGGGGAIVVN